MPDVFELSSSVPHGLEAFVDRQDHAYTPRLKKLYGTLTFDRLIKINPRYGTYVVLHTTSADCLVPLCGARCPSTTHELEISNTDNRLSKKAVMIFCTSIITKKFEDPARLTQL